MYNKKKKNEDNKNNLVSINSAALQDHILKTTNLDLNFLKKPKRILPMIRNHQKMQ